MLIIFFIDLFVYMCIFLLFRRQANGSSPANKYTLSVLSIIIIMIIIRLFNVELIKIWGEHYIRRINSYDIDGQHHHVILPK